MKRLACLLILLLLVTQTEGLALLRAGVKAGVNLANVDVSESNVNYKMKPGFAIGAFAEIPLAPSGTLAVRGELLYIQKGTKFSEASHDYSWSVDELILAPFAVLRIPSPKVTPFLEAGPEIGLNTIAKAKNSATSNFGPDWKNTNVSMNIGAGVMLPFGTNDLTVDARYNLGLVDMNDAAGASSTSKIKTNGIQLMVGLTFLKI